MALGRERKIVKKLVASQMFWLPVRDGSLFAVTLLWLLLLVSAQDYIFCCTVCPKHPQARHKKMENINF
jgi:hypothetical protein